MAAMGDNFQITAPDFGKNPMVFLREVKSELTKVNWPRRPEIIKLTGVVIGVTVLVGAYLGGLDFIFAKIIELLLRK